MQERVEVATLAFAKRKGGNRGKKEFDVSQCP